MTASQFTHAELRSALTFMLTGPVQSGNIDAAADTAVAIVQQALEAESANRLRVGDHISAYRLLFMADALAEPAEPEQQQDAEPEQDGAGE